MKTPDFDLENEDIPILEPSGIFKIWMWICGGVFLIFALMLVIGGILILLMLL